MPKLLNQVGTTLTPLSVYGYIEVAGKRYEARSILDTFIKKGAQVRVVGRENYAYLVEPV